MNNQSTKTSANKEKKIAIVAEIKEKLGRSKAMVFANYGGLTHKQLEDMKKEIKKLDATFVVAKNNLFKLAFTETGTAANEKQMTDEQLQGQTGAMFLYSDVVSPLKILSKMIKEIEKPEIKFGILDGKVISKADVLKLATLPNRETLISQMLGMMQSPTVRLVKALNWNIVKLAMTLNAVAKTKS